MPQPVKDAIGNAADIVWKELETTILEKSGVSTDPVMERYRLSLVRFRAKPLTCCDGPLTWIRSKVLYALMPSDGTLWSTLRDPFCCIVRILMVLPVISTCVFVTLFFMIEKRDEFQLVHYITMAKGFACVAMGIVPLVQAGIAMLACLTQVDHGDPDKCSLGASDGLLHYVLMVEPLRISVVWLAFALLSCGYARGGPQELVALEAVRIDLADGTLDGVFDQNKAYALDDDNPDNDPEVVKRGGSAGGALREMQNKLEAPVCHGRAMPYFFAYDVLALVTVAALMLPSQTNFDHPWMLWVTLHYMNVFYSLLAIPYILIALPFVSTMLTQAYPTGYDRAGNCGGMLTPEQIKQVRESEGQQEGVLTAVSKSKNRLISAIEEGIYNTGVGIGGALDQVGKFFGGANLGCGAPRKSDPPELY